MGSEVAKVVQQAGLIDSATLNELRKWGAPVVSTPEGPTPDPQIVPLLIERALQGQDFVQVKETDLEALKQYLQTQEVGTLKLEELNGNVVNVDVVFGRTPRNEYIIPWTDDSISEVLADCLVTLHEPDKGWVSLTSPRELYYGERKMFTIWTAEPS